MISVSIENSHTDPAGINFDVNNLNPAESEEMGATLTNYLCSIINRRNAVTLETMELGEQNANCVPYTSSCADNNSEISVSVRHFSVASRRSSVDSQVSQVSCVSVKMSETNIKATLESRLQKHKSVNMKTKKRQRNYMYAKRTNRRASSSSIESQRITNQMQNIKYKHPNRIQVSENTIGRQVGRRSAISATPANINDIKQILNRANFKFDDDDLSDDETQAVIETEPSNMLVPLGAHPPQPNDSTDSLEMSNKKNEASIEQILQCILKNSNGKQLENLLRRSYERSNERTEHASSTMGKRDRNSMKSSKNQRNSHSKMYAHQKNDEPISSKVKHDKETTNSISSSMDFGISAHLNGTQSSFSDQSMNRMKTQSQNSKRSCDVGIQANDYDIASHVKNRSRSRDDCDKDYLPEKLQSHYLNNQDDECTEAHQLLPMKKRDQPTIVRRNTTRNKDLSESERVKKLKQLLMP